MIGDPVLSRNDGKTPAWIPRVNSKPFERSHRPYASMNWIRFNGSLRATAVSQPLAGTPLVNVQRLGARVAGVKRVAHVTSFNKQMGCLQGKD
ncbi:hypothetical protein AM571_PC00917 (plasmid) [Rhizobium etli 8C-3]|uniref:Uncharacterized protein n=1 Tax=Rhizobium etli 8C-3 TaxID=538025 RepID=A0A1L5PET6_RHIET|nr:hypothetical protein AM571_PC00917 [Rhizobium etli 8C-3]